MKTLNIRASEEALAKLESLKGFGKGQVVSIAILDLKIERLLKILGQKSKEKK